MRFLKTMSNMDNKIIFQEHEYPILDPEEIEFGKVEDLERFKQILEEPVTEKNDDVPIIFDTATKSQENVVATKPKPKVIGRRRVVLTRSKARKVIQVENPMQTAVVQVPHESMSQPIQESTPISLRKRKAANIDDLNDIRSKKRKSLMTDLEDVTTVTSTSNEIDRLHQLFEDILKNGKMDFVANHKCIMNCSRQKATVLLPCKHQSTCNQCFVLWKVFLAKKRKNVFCPVCGINITGNIVINAS